MPPLETSDLYQDAVLWPFAGADRYGQFTVSTPVPLLVRWVWKQTEMLDPQNNTIAVDATAVVDLDIRVGSIMWAGCLDDLNLVGTGPPPVASSPPDLYEVKAFNKTYDLRGRDVRRTLGLMKYRNKLPTVVPVATTTVLTTSGSPVAFGTILTLTATVAPPASSPTIVPGGLCYFFDGAVLLGNSPVVNGVATFAISTLGRGAHSLIGQYQGDQKCAASVSAILSQQVV
jgi:hypothetical protein